MNVRSLESISQNLKKLLNMMAKSKNCDRKRKRAAAAVTSYEEPPEIELSESNGKEEESESEEELEEMEEDKPCQKCKHKYKDQEKEETQTIMCDGCNMPYHWRCVDLMKGLPKGDWFCAECMTEERQKNLLSAESVEPWVVNHIKHYNLLKLKTDHYPEDKESDERKSYMNDFGVFNLKQIDPLCRGRCLFLDGKSLFTSKKLCAAGYLRQNLIVFNNAVSVIDMLCNEYSIVYPFSIEYALADKRWCPADETFSFVWLDFCCTWNVEVELALKQLFNRELLDSPSILGITVSKRGQLNVDFIPIEKRVERQISDTNYKIARALPHKYEKEEGQMITRFFEIEKK